MPLNAQDFRSHGINGRDRGGGGQAQMPQYLDHDLGVGEKRQHRIEHAIAPLQQRLPNAQAIMMSGESDVQKTLACLQQGARIGLQLRNAPSAGEEGTLPCGLQASAGAASVAGRGFSAIHPTNGRAPAPGPRAAGILRPAPPLAQHRREGSCGLGSRAYARLSFSNSPCIRGAPRSGLARDICRIRSRISAETLGRPGLRLLPCSVVELSSIGEGSSP
jgi:hypothetical protein